MKEGGSRARFQNRASRSRGDDQDFGRGAHSAGVQSHLDYIGREGKGEVETDEGVRVQEKGFERACEGLGSRS